MMSERTEASKEMTMIEGDDDNYDSWSGGSCHDGGGLS